MTEALSNSHQNTTGGNVTALSQSTTSKKIPPFCKVLEDGTVQYNFHPGQSRMMLSRKRRVVFVAGTRAGKSAAGPAWLLEEIRDKGPGHYIVAAPTRPLLERGAAIELGKLFEDTLRLGSFKQNPSWRFLFSPEGAEWTFEGTRWENEPNKNVTIWMIHASDSNALEALTAKGAWLDEAGQDDFKAGSYEAVERRISLDPDNPGNSDTRILITTTPYSLNWLYTKLVLPWKKAKASGGDHPRIDVINCKSIENPAFPMAEYLAQQADMPPWRFQMMYDGQFTVPSGLVYDCAKDREFEMRLPRVPLPQDSVRLVGIDFGGINTAAIYGAQFQEEWTHPCGVTIPRGGVVLYREYHPGKAMPIMRHADNIQAGEPYIERCAGGAKSEDQWREEFTECGLYVERPRIHQLDVGINRVYGLIARGLLFAFEDLHEFWREIFEYRYEIDPDSGEVLPDATGKLKIVEQNAFHILDSLRYLSSLIVEELEGMGVATAGGQSRQGGYYDELNGRNNPSTEGAFRVVNENANLSEILKNSPAYAGPKSGRLRMGRGDRITRTLAGQYGDQQLLRRRGLI